MRNYNISNSGISAKGFSHRPISVWLRSASGRSSVMYAVYFALSLKNNKVYVGYTKKDPEVRIKEHNSNTNKWSKENKPFKLVYYEHYQCLEDAKRRELFYKSGFGRKIKTAILESIGD